MPNVLKKFLYSRKFWAFLAGIVTLASAAAQDGVFTPDETWQLVTLFGSYIFSVAFEDGLSNRNATQTTVSTPSENVVVSTSDTTSVGRGVIR